MAGQILPNFGNIAISDLAEHIILVNKVADFHVAVLIFLVVPEGDGDIFRAVQLLTDNAEQSV